MKDGGWQRWCVKDGGDKDVVWQSCVLKTVCERWIKMMAFRQSTKNWLIVKNQIALLQAWGKSNPKFDLSQIG